MHHLQRNIFLTSLSVSYLFITTIALKSAQDNTPWRLTYDFHYCNIAFLKEQKIGLVKNIIKIEIIYHQDINGALSFISSQLPINPFYDSLNNIRMTKNF